MQRSQIRAFNLQEVASGLPSREVWPLRSFGVLPSGFQGMQSVQRVFKSFLFF